MDPCIFDCDEDVQCDHPRVLARKTAEVIAAQHNAANPFCRCAVCTGSVPLTEEILDASLKARNQ